MEKKGSVTELLNKYFDGVLYVLNYLSAVLILVICVWIVADVIGRVVFNHPLVGTPEIAANSMAAIAFLQMPYTLKEQKHIRSMMILDRLGPKSQDILNIFACLLGVVLFVMTFASNWEPTVTSWIIGEYEGEGALRVPSYPVRTIILISSALMAILFMINMVRIILKIQNVRKKGVSF